MAHEVVKNVPAVREILPELPVLLDHAQKRRSQKLIFTRQEHTMPVHMPFSAGIELVNGERYIIAGRKFKKELTPDGIKYTFPGTKYIPEFTWQLQRGEQPTDTIFNFSVKNTTEQPLPLEKLIMFSLPDQPVSAASQSGWETQSPAHPPWPLSQFERPQVDDEYMPSSRIGPIDTANNPDSSFIPWMTQAIIAGQPVLFGFTTAKDQAGFIEFKPGRSGYDVSIFTAAEGIELAPNATVNSEKLSISLASDQQLALSNYYQTVARDMGAILPAEQAEAYIFACSWYQHEWDINEEIVKRDVDFLAAHKDTLHTKGYILDDYFDPNRRDRIGEWTKESQQFLSGFKALTGYIHSHGMQAIRWLAPAYVSSESELARDHPDWFVTDDTGKPINAKTHWGTSNYVLDITNPDVEDYVRQVIRTNIDEYGFDGFKLDFMFAATLRGHRHEKNVTGIQAYRRLLTILNEETRGKIVLGCGMPMLPSVGKVAFMRVGPDSGNRWKNPAKDGAAPCVYYAIRANGARAEMNGVLWANDPDAVLVRENNSYLTLPEIQSWLTMVSLTNSVFTLGDYMNQLEPERLRLLEFALPPIGGRESGRPVKFAANGMPVAMRLGNDQPWEHWTTAALFNFRDQPQEPEFDPSEFSLNTSDWHHLFNPLTGEYYGKIQGKTKLPPIPAHGVCLLSVHKDLGRPQIVGTTSHISGGAAEFARVEWDDNTMGIKMKQPRPGYAAIYVPEDYHYQGEGEMERIPTGGYLLKIPLQTEEEIIVPFSHIPENNNLT
jgi:alpha-galactosidase